MAGWISSPGRRMRESRPGHQKQPLGKPRRSASAAPGVEDTDSAKGSVVSEDDFGVFGDTDHVEEGRDQAVRIDKLYNTTFGMMA